MVTLALAGFAAGASIPVLAWLSLDSTVPALSAGVLIPAALLLALLRSQRLRVFLFLLLCLFGYARSRGAVLAVMSDYSECSWLSSLRCDGQLAARVDAFRVCLRERAIVVSALTLDRISRWR